jgi:hypothetical protein
VLKADYGRYFICPGVHSCVSAKTHPKRRLRPLGSQKNCEDRLDCELIERDQRLLIQCHGIIAMEGFAMPSTSHKKLGTLTTTAKSWSRWLYLPPPLPAQGTTEPTVTREFPPPAAGGPPAVATVLLRHDSPSRSSRPADPKRPTVNHRGIEAKAIVLASSHPRQRLTATVGPSVAMSA